MSKNKKAEFRFKDFSADWKTREIGDILTEKYQPILIEDEKEYQLVTVKRRNEGVVSRGYLKGKKILVKNYFEVNEGDFIISKRQIIHGASGIVPKSLHKAVVSNEYLVAASNENISTEYWTLISKLPDMHKIFFLSSYGVDIEKMVFNVGDWKKRSITIPTINEQNKITILFDDLDRLIIQHQQKHNKLKALKKAMLNKMFPKHGQLIPEIRFKGFAGDWEEKKLGNIGDPYSGLSGKTKTDFGHGEARYITYLNVFLNSISDVNAIDKIEIDSIQNEVITGDVLFTISSETAEEVGMASVWTGNLKNIYLNSFCFGYRPKIKIDNYFLASQLRAQTFRKKMTFLAQGISRYNISKNKVMELNIMLPSDDEQRAIGIYFKKVDHLISNHALQITKLQNIKKAFLAKMFI